MFDFVDCLITFCFCSKFQLSNSNGNLNHIETAYSHQTSRRRGPIQYLCNKLRCLRHRHDDDLDIGFRDPQITITREEGETASDLSTGKPAKKSLSCLVCECCFEPSSRASYWWSFIVCLAVIYNYWVIIFRYTFDEITLETCFVWFMCDYTMDLIYLLDIFKGLRTAYLDQGVVVRDVTKMGLHYRNTMVFYADWLCLLPLDLIYLSVGFKSLLRSARLIKIYKVWTFLDTTERHTNFPNLIRTLSMVHYLLIIFHWNASLFFTIMKQSAAFHNDDFDITTSTGKC